MTRTARTLSSLILMLSLAGCDQIPSPVTSVNTDQVSLPALPYIEQSVFALTPTLNGNRMKQDVMARLCMLARDEISQEELSAFLREQGVNVEKIPAKGNPLSPLVNGDKSDQTVSCAAFMATSVLLPPDAADFARVPAEDEEGSSNLRIDAVALNTKQAIARTNADFFTLIAMRLAREPGQPVSHYQQRAMEMFSLLAPAYLKAVPRHLLPENSRYQLKLMNENSFSFTTSTGLDFDYTSSGLSLWQNGTLWYGQGNLLGQERLIEVDYFEAGLSELLDQQNP